MNLSFRERASLDLFRNTATLDLRSVGEKLRQGLIDLGMREPPLVDVDADRVYLTQAGREALL